MGRREELLRDYDGSDVILKTFLRGVSEESFEASRKYNRIHEVA